MGDEGRDGGGGRSQERGWVHAVASAQFILGGVLVQQPDVREGEVAALALALALPLAVHIDLGHLHHVAHLHGEKPAVRDMRAWTPQQGYQRAILTYEISMYAS